MDQALGWLSGGVWEAAVGRLLARERALVGRFRLAGAVGSTVVLVTSDAYARRQAESGSLLVSLARLLGPYAPPPVRVVTVLDPSPQPADED